MTFKQPAKKYFSGFTIVELLIALTIMGTIAAFTIPKVVNGINSNDYKYRVQMAAAMISTAYNKAQMDNAITITTKPSDLTPYMSYVNYKTTGSIDSIYNATGTMACDATHACITLHNGAVIRFYDADPFGSLTAAHYAIIFHVDADGVMTSSGTTDGPSKSVELYLYATNGRVVDRSLIDNLTYCGASGGDGVCTSGRAPGNYTPTWFSWD